MVSARTFREPESHYNIEFVSSKLSLTITRHPEYNCDFHSISLDRDPGIYLL